MATPIIVSTTAMHPALRAVLFQMSASERMLLRIRNSGQLHSDDADQFLHRFRAAIQLRLLLRTEPDFDDLFDPVCSQFDGHAYEKTINPVLALQICSTRQCLLLIFEDGLDH